MELYPSRTVCAEREVFDMLFAEQSQQEAVARGLPLQTESLTPAEQAELVEDAAYAMKSITELEEHGHLSEEFEEFMFEMLSKHGVLLGLPEYDAVRTRMCLLLFRWVDYFLMD